MSSRFLVAVAILLFSVAAQPSEASVIPLLGTQQCGIRGAQTVARPVYLPAAVIGRSSLNPNAKALVAQQPICAVSGDSIFVRPTIIVHTFKLEKSGYLRSHVRSFAYPLSIQRLPTSTVLRFSSGKTRHFASTAVIDQSSPDNYRVYIVTRNAPRPASLNGLIADYIVP